MLWRWRRGFFVAGFLALVLVATGLYSLSRLPLPNRHPQPQTTYVYSSNGRLLTTYQQQNRTDVKLSQVPKVLIDAVVATEDKHFFTEGPINPISIVRAGVHDLLGSGELEGGSTITQQYVKQTYLSPQRTITRKLKEALIAVKLEHEDSKDQILQGYLNTIYLGRGAYGVEAAAQTYFGKNVQDLGLDAASLLAGLIREPDVADPAVNPNVARENQDATLTAMVADHDITASQAAQVEATPFSDYVRPASDDVATNVAAIPGDRYFLAAVHAELVAAYGANEVERGGLRVWTTLNPTMQDEAYQAVYGKGPDALDPARGTPSGALVSLADNGDVEALVGGQNYATSQVDLALGSQGGGSGRQSGSTFKAFMLADLIKRGYSVESTFQAPAKIIIPHANNGKNWSVSNDEGEASTSRVSIVNATALSLNTVYAQLVAKLGAASLDKTAEEMGIPASELPGNDDSRVLGTAAVSPLQMAAAYATFADGGVYNSPVLITKVTTAAGKVLPLPKQVRRRVLTPAQVSLIDYVLQQVVIYGTGTAAGGLGTPVAGKTGTTEHSSDAWFIGYTTKLTTAVWMGYTNSERSMNGFRGFEQLNGGTVPAAIWHDAMAAFLKTDPADKTPFPTVSSFGGATLTAPTDVVIPTTTTTLPPATVPPITTTTLPTSTTTLPETTSPTSPPTTSPPTTAPPPTAPPTTAPPTTAPPGTPPPTPPPTTAPPTTAPPGTPPPTAPPTTGAPSTGRGHGSG